MQSFYPERFERDMATTEVEWLAALPRAVGEHPCAVQAGHAEIRIQHGRLLLQWHVLPPRVIALLRLQRLAVVFAFDGVDDAERQRFMKRFDLTMQRGGG
ncbi:hypothetical protein [Limnohabitans sp.]|uniref:hypothetical protein n=1 Tax=Limnohabitans sp. TaxID=1907725 RepID=UPI00289C9C68|nr:hypothetical protein [Limnohabitans sp.]